VVGCGYLNVHISPAVPQKKVECITLSIYQILVFQNRSLHYCRFIHLYTPRSGDRQQTHSTAETGAYNAHRVHKNAPSPRIMA